MDHAGADRSDHRRNPVTALVRQPAAAKPRRIPNRPPLVKAGDKAPDFTVELFDGTKPPSQNSKAKSCY